MKIMKNVMMMEVKMKKMIMKMMIMMVKMMKWLIFFKEFRNLLLLFYKKLGEGPGSSSWGGP